MLRPNMSTDNSVKSDAMSRCANCGASEGEDTKLKTCTGCKSVKYCGIKCQKKHRSKHKRDCKKRAAELKDEILFRQPESNHWGDCPICFLPMPIENHKSTFMNCCSKTICVGCSHACTKMDAAENLKKCPFCRDPYPESEAESWKITNEKAASMKCPASMREVGLKHYKKGEFEVALNYFSKAAEMGDLEGICFMGEMYYKGEGVERNVLKAIHFSEKAAVAGHPRARYNLAGIESFESNGSGLKAIRHWLIAAKQGEDESLKYLKMMFKAGVVRKDDFAAALRGHQAAVDATKSPQREEAYRSEHYLKNKPVKK